MATTNGTLKYKQDDGSIVELNPVGVDNTARARLDAMTVFPTLADFLAKPRLTRISEMQYKTVDGSDSGVGRIEWADRTIGLWIHKPYNMTITESPATPFEVIVQLQFDTTLFNGNRCALMNAGLALTCTSYHEYEDAIYIGGEFKYNTFTNSAVNSSVKIFHSVSPIAFVSA